MVRAAQRLAGDDAGAVCEALALWRSRGHDELPWLASPGLSVLADLGVTGPAGADLQVLERFLLGAESDADQVLASIDRAVADAGPSAAAPPPDARGALVDVTERFFDLLDEGYREISGAVRRRHRGEVDGLISAWQPRLDEAAADIEARAEVLRQGRPRAAPSPKPVKERAALAAGFVVLALLTAGVMLWLVLQGWPMEPVSFGL